MIIYPAAALFNASETFFNLSLVTLLEQRYGHKAFLPQRDGFEFSGLLEALRNVLPEKTPATDILSAEQLIIYYLDMGIFIPSSDIIVANLDEPVDEGVIVEVSYAKLMGKPVLGVRSDARSPFGGIGEPLGGIHFFPAFQVDELLRVCLSGNTNLTAANTNLDSIARTIDERIRGLVKEIGTPLPQYVLDNPIIAQLLNGARLMFDNIEIDDINSPAGMKQVLDNYIANRAFLEQLFPAIP